MKKNQPKGLDAIFSGVFAYIWHFSVSFDWGLCTRWRSIQLFPRDSFVTRMAFILKAFNVPQSIVSPLLSPPHSWTTWLREILEASMALGPDLAIVALIIEEVTGHPFPGVPPNAPLPDAPAFRQSGYENEGGSSHSFLS